MAHRVGRSQACVYTHISYADSPPEKAAARGPTSLAAATALADSSEPRYCVCNNVSYGEMIACDNPDCIVEWFHYECVGITQQPKG